ncbi:MAG: hypothetical protein ACJA01_004160 [Saprospiraceae bacterium]
MCDWSLIKSVSSCSIVLRMDDTICLVSIAELGLLRLIYNFVQFVIHTSKTHHFKNTTKAIP